MFERSDEYSDLGRAVLVPLQFKQISVVTSTLTVAEVLVHPLKTANQALITAYNRFFTPSSNFEIQPVNQEIAKIAAKLRAEFGLKGFDAVHAATAINSGCKTIITGDSVFSRLGLEVISPEAFRA